MRKLLFLLFPLLCSAQQGVCEQTDSLRSVKIKLVDTKGRPVRSGNLSFALTRETDMQPLSSRGWSVIESVQDTDTLMIALNGYVGKLPLAGLDSVEITDKRRDIEVKDPSGSVNVGYQSIQYRHNTHTTATLNMRKEHSLIGYKDLAAYLQGRVAGLKVVNTDTGVEIFIRGENNSFMGSQAALIIVDGTECLGFDQANGMVNVNDVERVDVIKDGEGYGSRGANGVVIITTKKGGASK